MPRTGARPLARLRQSRGVLTTDIWLKTYIFDLATFYVYGEVSFLFILPPPPPPVPLCLACSRRRRECIEKRARVRRRPKMWFENRSINHHQTQSARPPPPTWRVTRATKKWSPPPPDVSISRIRRARCAYHTYIAPVYNNILIILHTTKNRLSTNGFGSLRARARLVVRAETRETDRWQN